MPTSAMTASTDAIVSNGHGHSSKATATNGTSTSTDERPTALDLSHHLSLLARSRRASPLKDIIRYMAVPGIISLAGGLPPAAYFPFHSVSASAYPASTVLDPETGTPPADSVEVVIPRHKTSDTAFDIAGGLQYTGGSGLAKFAELCKDLTERMWEPVYSDWDILVNSGGTDAWTKVITMLLERGEYVITETQVYPSAQASFIPMGVTAFPIEDDGEGMRADALEAALAGWDESRGRRPRVMYLVPVGQNPLGTTMGAQRRQAIYDVCVKYDVVIIEDDPYTVLQFEPWVVGSKSHPPVPAKTNEDVAAFLDSMVKSFLTIDVQGRVIRLDTFSKTLAPGARLGWFTGSKMFIERLLRGTEVQTQMPSGISSVVIGELLNKWGLDGYLLWITNLREQYRVRRDWMLDALSASFDLVPAESTNVAGAIGLVAYPKGQAHTGPALMSFVPPTGGMFVWCRMYYRTHPQFASFAASYKPEHPEDGDATQAFEAKFWVRLVEALVLLTPGWYFTAFEGEGVSSYGQPGVGAFRLAFSFEPKDLQEEGIRRMARVMTEEWCA